MSIAVVRYLNRVGPRALRLPFQNILRASSNEPCPPTETPKPCPKAEAAPPPEPPPPPPPTASGPGPTPPPDCPPPPPCPSMPVCPPAICPDIADSGDPCHYCPPPCIDPDYPDLTKLKKLQCYFQQNDDLPTYIAKGNSDAFLYQLSIVVIMISLVSGLVSTAKLK